VAGGVAAEVCGVVLDRLADRIVAGALLPTMRAIGTQVIDAGLAATGNRLSIASTLASVGIPRPATLLACSEDSGLAAMREFGYPATLLPLDCGSDEIQLRDRDIAEAVFEHREVLGASLNNVSLIQAGAAETLKRVDVLVIGGDAVASSEPVSIETLELASAAASTLRASMLGVTVAFTASGPVVWDVQAVPRFKEMLVTHRDAIATAFARLVGQVRPSGAVSFGHVPWNAEIRGEVTGDVVLSA
jgi:glutathione synthase/RimK-type ligase-like ATP-grasp enzyme